MAKKDRVDQILVDRGMAADLDDARRLVMAGKILSEGQLVLAPSQRISFDGELSLIQDAPFVSRGGDKLQAAFEEFNLSVEGLNCADVGASTGGFTDCLLQHGAAKVYAIDVGYGILDWRLRNDPRVIVLERTNARQLSRLPEPVNFITADVSFISLKMILPSMAGWLSDQGGEVVLLVKPQFEATREESAPGAGVITSPEIQRRVVLEVLGAAAEKGFNTLGVIRSPLRGPAGNEEFLAWLTYAGAVQGIGGLDEMLNTLF
jgi:23S rRNA (cytidine1920-2'-O)/16S rRNA (cytidine1409-2'-O)-methyltransferase